MTDREIMQQALDALEYHTMQTRPINHTDKAIEVLRQALAQPEQAPVAMVTGYKSGHCVIAPIGGNTIFQTGLALYTAPPKREWVGLTSEELATIVVEHAGFPTKQAQAINEKLKEKNT